jgi:nucleotide-binding universal stress UspA family protein
MKKISKVLITTDLSGFSISALEVVRSMKDIARAKLYLLYVEEATPPVLYSLYVRDQDEKTFNASVMQAARDRLDKFIKEKAGRKLHLVPIVRRGNPPEEIQRFTKEEKIDLVVMATHGRSGLKYVLLGSVAEKVIRMSAVPVLMVKPGNGSAAKSRPATRRRKKRNRGTRKSTSRKSGR